MITFDIIINGKRAKRIGINGHGVISAVVSSAKRLSKGEKVRLHAGGLTQKAKGERIYLKWLDKALAVGDEVAIRICGPAKCDAPVSTNTETKASVIKAKKKYLRVLKEDLGGR